MRWFPKSGDANYEYAATAVTKTKYWAEYKKQEEWLVDFYDSDNRFTSVQISEFETKWYFENEKDAIMFTLFFGDSVI